MTKIEWADESWNPIGLVGGGHGCAKVSPGCANCYAEAFSKRFWGTPKYDHRRRNYELRDPDFKKLKKFKDGSIVFVQSMSDLFHRDVPLSFHLDVFNARLAFPELTFLWLTKHPDRMQKVIQTCNESPPNLWLGVTTENQQEADRRIPILLTTPAAKRFVSVEPMLGPVDLEPYLVSCTDCGNRGSGALVPWEDNLCARACNKYDGPPLDWVIIGCESGPKRRPLELEWMLDLVRACKNYDVACFVKQVPDANGKVIKDWNNPAFPDELKVRQFPTEVREAK